MNMNEKWWPFIEKNIKRLPESTIDFEKFDPFVEIPMFHDDLVAIFWEACYSKTNNKQLDPADQKGMYLYAWVRIVLADIGDQWLTSRVADMVSKTYFKHALEEPVSVIQELASAFGVTMTCINERGELAIPVLQYATIPKRFRALSWKLVNSNVKGGYVYISKPQACRIISEMIREKTGNLLDIEEIEPFLITNPRYFVTKQRVEDMSNQLKEKLQVPEIPLVPRKIAGFPPCIKIILERNKLNVNLTHDERVFLVSFLGKVGFELDEIIEIFRAQPDFSMKETVYQVRFLLNNGYMPMNCGRVKSLHVCPRLPPCTTFKHEPVNPLVVYKWLVKTVDPDIKSDIQGWVGEIMDDYVDKLSKIPQPARNIPRKNEEDD